MTTSRLRNLALPLALAVMAAVLVGLYVVSYRNSVTHGAGLVKVLVAARDIPAGTDGSSVAAGGYLKTQTIPRRAVVPGSVTSAEPLTSLVAGTDLQGRAGHAAPVHAGVTGRHLRQLLGYGARHRRPGRSEPAARRDAFRRRSRRRRGDDEVPRRRPSRATSKVILRNLLVLKAPEGAAEGIGRWCGDHVGAARHDRRAGADHVVGAVADEVVPGAAPDEQAEGQPPAARHAGHDLRSRTACCSAADRRELQGERRCPVTATTRRSACF